VGMSAIVMRLVVAGLSTITAHNPLLSMVTGAEKAAYQDQRLMHVTRLYQL